ncbi:chitin deacetylase family protein [Synechococcus sp. CCY9202]|uniref:chitin deacetylase family protein n=1 Tax=Synechococcus sp. CCY9202 TaxID=174698 RepID=UPI002B1FB488|nr:chitin deacetylase family protein [Synechococcus sp. CCY9202]MEA5424351.1 chitin deacetylase family protein [Synechococcus sp. CCY9202]
MDGIPLLLLALSLILLSDLVAFGLLLPSLLIRTVLARRHPDVVFCGAADRRRLALTIDDGPSGPGSGALLDLLRELDVPATFFLVGSHLERDPHFPRRALQEGHDLGNHLWRDERTATLAEPAFLQQLRDTQRAIERAALPERLTWRWCRPGQGWFHRPMVEWLRGRRYRLVLASIFPWDTLRPPMSFMRWFVRINAHPGGILVLHDTPALSGRTLRALRRIIPDLQRLGYTFVPLAELLDAE